MPHYTITATSAKANTTANTTVSNTNTKRFPSPAEFADQAAADAQAAKYAKDVNFDDHLGVWDWVGKATPV
jgi:hypothetical protein